MNFQKLAPVPQSKELLDRAFRKARQKEQGKSLVGNWLQILRKKEAMKLDIIRANLVEDLKQILNDFPQTAKLPVFYLKLIQLTVDYPLLKKSLGGLNWGMQKINFLHREYVRKINTSKEKNLLYNASKEFYGRISSVLKQISDNLAYLEECRKVMRTYPDIKEMFTVGLYGFPNVGKTTLLNKLAGTKAEVANYAFTTKTINAGYLIQDGKKVQILDLPGTLARQEKMNNIEFQAELVLQELTDLVIFVFDISEISYPFDKQEELLKKVRSMHKIVLVYLSKADLLDEDAIKKFKIKNYSVEEIKEIIAEKYVDKSKKEEVREKEE